MEAKVGGVGAAGDVGWFAAFFFEVVAEGFYFLGQGLGFLREFFFDVAFGPVFEDQVAVAKDLFNAGFLRDLEGVFASEQFAIVIGNISLRAKVAFGI